VTDQRRPSEDVLRAELRRAAAEHEPGRTAMLNRIATNRASLPTARAKKVRLAGSTPALAVAMAVAAVLGLSGLAGWALADEHGPNLTPAVPPPSSAQVSTGPAGRSPSPTRQPDSNLPRSTPPSSASAAASASTLAVRGHPGDTQVEKGSLWSDGSIEPAGASTPEQSTVTLKAHADLTELDLTIRVAITPGLAEQGGIDDVATDVITVTVERRSDALLYHFVLRDGATLPAGTYVFSARYTHDGTTRNAGDDTYEAFAADADHKRPHVYGNFYTTTK
jgi:hypothetical protein